MAEIVEFPHKIPSVYRGGAKWLIAPSFEQKAMELAYTTTGQPAFVPATTDFGLPKLRNYPYLVCPWLDYVNPDKNSAVDATSGNKIGSNKTSALDSSAASVVAAFGDFSYFTEVLGANGDIWIFPFWDSNTSLHMSWSP